VLVPAVVVASGAFAGAQQTLGNLQGTVTDSTGAVVAGAQVQLSGDNNGIKLSAKTQKNGVYQFQNLPIGNYTLTFSQSGFESTRVPAVTVQENRTGSINVSLKTGSASETIEVNEQPLLNQTDATNGYILEGRQLQELPLATGSYTQAAILAPGVNSELLSGIGTNAGLGNSPLWANGQRDTSNSFQVNGVDVTNLFNGKSSSESESQRYGFNIGQQGQGGVTGASGSGGGVAGQNSTSSSVYGSNGNGLATPPPEFIQELRVNTSQYDAAQGNRSGAQINVSTSTGDNQFHGQAWGNRATNALNAAPYFNKQAVAYQALPYAYLVPQLHRDVVGGTLGGPLIHNKLFFFLGYQNLHDADASRGYSLLQVPNDGLGNALTDDRSTAGILKALQGWDNVTTANGGTGQIATSAITLDPVAVALLNVKLFNGQYLIPSVNIAQSSPVNLGADVFLNEKALSRADMATGAVDYNVTDRDRLSAKYFYQHNPVLSPFANAITYGFPQQTDNGAQVGTLTNTVTLGSRVNWEQRIGFSRSKVYGTYSPQFQNSTFGIGFPGGTGLPALSLGKFGYSGSSASGGTVSAGPAGTFANAGYFQNRLNPETNVVFTLGKHNLSAGGNYTFTQLNIRNRKSYLGSASTTNFPLFLEGQLSSASEVIGTTNRYYRANEDGIYLQDQFRPVPNLSLTAGIRYDYDGGFSEKYGNLFNFDPTRYQVSATAVTSSGFIVAGNNAYCATAGNTCVNNTTLTGRQWGVSPRLGFAYSPAQNQQKVVFRGSLGFYYDRGEYFQYLSQPAGGGVSGPFGVTQAAPLANTANSAGNPTFEMPLGSATLPSVSANPNAFTQQLLTLQAIKTGCAALLVEERAANCPQPYYFADYARANKLPYTINYAFNVQVQLASDLVATIGYAGNVGRHGVIPVPFNQPGIATSSNPINGETASYGYTTLNANSLTPVVSGTKTTSYYNPISTEPYSTYEGGNTDLRVPFVGYSANATSFEAVGVSAYNALQAQLQKRLTHNISFGASYTWSHALDEQSDVGLFFTGDNPAHLRDSYASADFDRTNVLVFNYVFQLPKYAAEESLLGKFVDGWQLVGITKLQSGEPYSLYDFAGGVGSVYYGNSPELANPVLGVKNGRNPRSAETGAVGTQLTNISCPAATPNNCKYSYVPVFDNAQLQINNLAPGQKGVPLQVAGEPADLFETDFTPGQRNIFKQDFQKDADVSLQKITHINEHVTARYTFDVYNVTNSASFDIPNNNISIGAGSLTPTTTATGVTSTVQSGQVVTSLATNSADVTRLYNIPVNGANSNGSIRNTIGQPRTIEMSLHILF
jgi:hypothetical protein